jgi:ferredoxin
MSNIFLKKMDKIEVEANKCLKIRAVTSSCTACKDVCPVDSIDITQDAVEIKDCCIECGLCTSVCQTNALKWIHPPHIQLLDRLKRLSDRENEVYIGCTTSIKGQVLSNVVEVPCLGMLPIEFWISSAVRIPNMVIYYPPNDCDRCKTHEGATLFLNHKKKAEAVLDHTLSISASINKGEDDALIDHNRRRFFSTLMEEAKETNTITMREVMEVETTLSPFEKFDRHIKQQTDIEELTKSATEMKDQLVDRLLNGSVIHTDKRAMLLQAIEKDRSLPEKITFFIPKVEESCSLCGACAILCPTDAMIMDEETLILSTDKCVSCGLCEEICYEKHIHMTKRSGTVFNEKYLYLTHKKSSAQALLQTVDNSAN